MKTKSVLFFLLIQVIQMFCYNRKEMPLEPHIGPRGMPYNKTTSCSEFGENARFNPFSVVGHHWFIFYYWDTPKPPMSYIFRVPNKKDIHYLHYLMDTHIGDNFNWSARMLLQTSQQHFITNLLVEVGDKGQYHLYIFDDLVNMPIGSILTPYNVRFKQVNDGKYIGYMECTTHAAYVMSKIEEVPPKQKLQEEALKLGYIGRKGKSYLYHGNEFMPVPDGDEDEYWHFFYGELSKSRKQYLKD